MAKTPNLFNLDPTAFRLAQQNRGGMFRGVNTARGRRGVEGDGITLGTDPIALDPRVSAALAAPAGMESALGSYSSKYMGAVNDYTDMKNKMEARQTGKQVLSIIPYAKAINWAETVSRVMGDDGGVNDKLKGQAEKLNDPLGELTFDFNKTLDNVVGDFARDIQEGIGSLLGMDDGGPSPYQKARAERPKYIVSDAETWAKQFPELDPETSYNNLIKALESRTSSQRTTDYIKADAPSSAYTKVGREEVYDQSKDPRYVPTTRPGNMRPNEGPVYTLAPGYQERRVGRDNTEIVKVKTGGSGSYDPVLDSLKYDEYLVPNVKRGSVSSGELGKYAMTPEEKELFRQALQIQYGSIAAANYKAQVDARNKELRDQHAAWVAEVGIDPNRFGANGEYVGAETQSRGDALSETDLYSDDLNQMMVAKRGK